VGVSLLTNLRLEDLIAGSPDSYVSIAAGLANDQERLRQLRRGMRARMHQSPLLDAEGFTRRLEEAYRRIWFIHLERATAVP
jgi:predicted O-linked N-acetylglucosamine transferase (SPINDLY family)